MAILDKQQQSHRLKSLRRNSHSMPAIAIDCDYVQLEHFMRIVIPEYSQALGLIEFIHNQMRGIAHRVKVNGVSGCNGDLLNAIAILEEFLSACQELTSQTTFEVLTFIGQIKAAQRDTTGATLAFTKALWIASASEEVAEVHLAAALHRLGLTYAQGRHYLQARDVLRKALETYKSAGYSSHQANDARALVEEVNKKWRESEESWSSLRSSTCQRLAQILE